MKYLTEKELGFIEALKKDLEINGEKSFIKILWHGFFDSEEYLRKEIANVFNDYYVELFKNSDLIMESVNGLYIGKYKENFWGTGSEGEVFGLGKEIQNIAFYVVLTYYGQVLEPDEKVSVVEYFRNHLNLNYETYIQSYRDFCKSLGYEYKESLEIMEKQSEEFEKELPLLE